MLQGLDSLCGRIHRISCAGVAFAILTLHAAAAFPSRAAVDLPRSIGPAPMVVETEPAPDLGPDLPPPAYPIQPLDQIPLRGARHGFVSTTKGNLVFRALDLRLSGRTPLELARVYDSSEGEEVAQALTPGVHPRWMEDFGPGWGASFASVLIPTGTGVVLANPSTGRLEWTEATNGSFALVTDVPSVHWRLARTGSDTIVERRRDGSEWTYKTLSSTSGQYVLTSVRGTGDNLVEFVYTQGYVSEIHNTAGQWIRFARKIYDSTLPASSAPSTRVEKVTDSSGRRTCRMKRRGTGFAAQSSTRYLKKRGSELATPVTRALTDPLAAWTVKRIRLDGRPFRFDGHEYLRGIFDDTSQHVVLSKAAQIGGTTWALLFSLHACLQGLHVAYYFPTKTDVLEFSKSRVSPLLAENPFLFAACAFADLRV